VTALDPKTGRQIWASPVNWQSGAKGVGYGQNYAEELLLSAYASLLSVVGDTVFFANGSGEVWALEISTGALKWKYSYDDLFVNQGGAYMASNVFASAHLVVVPYQDASGANAAAPVNGFVALDPASGSLLGKYPLPTDGYSGWQLIVSGKNVYGTNGTSVCAFEGGAR
jgi:outer membrane protein assembly factor BamB